jgi:hypothetical protein
VKIKPIRLFLLSTAVMLLLACGGTAEPEVDIEATVQARLVEERAAEATMEAKAKNLVEATLTAVPTWTPVPKPTPTPTTHQKLTEEQAINALISEMSKKKNKAFYLYGCFLECDSAVFYQGGKYFSDGDFDPVYKPVRIHSDKWWAGDRHGTYKHTWTADYIRAGWWLISAKQLGYWILNEDKELTMTCEAFLIPELMSVMGKYIDMNAPGARSICSKALGL